MEQCNASDSYNYMINNEIIFNPDKRLLYRVGDENNTETLNSPTAKCFLLLISRNGIVDQATIYSYVWGENESLITPNNLYQNISLIRRALSKLSPGLSLIKTIPRIGFSIDTAVIIEKIASDEECYPVCVEDVYEPEIKSVQELDGNEKQSGFLTKALSYRPAIISLVILTAIVSIMSTFAVLGQSSYFSNYKQFLTVGDCKIYSSNATKRNVNFVIDELTKTCGKTPWNYISYHDLFSDISTISCKQPMGIENNNECKSKYFFMGVKQ